MMSSSRDNWERLVAAVLKRDEIRQLCHQNSISTTSSDSPRTSTSSGDLSRILGNILKRIPVSPPHQPPLISAPGLEAGKNASGPITRKLFSASLWRRKPKDYNLGQGLVGIPEDHFGLGSFLLRELLVATDNFSNNNVVGHDRLGKVYKGRLADGSLVQVTRIRRQEIEINLEITSIAAAHCNVLRARGFCFTQKEKLLVYPFMVNKSVEFWLRERNEPLPPLDWPTRRYISLGAAKGLAYLHYSRGIVHHDVKAANIWLDENFEAVVVDLTLGEFVDCCDNDIVFPLKGTLGHIAPEYLATGKCSVKIDVFGYGIFLLELITAQRALDLARLADDNGMMFLDWVNEIYKEKEWKVIVDAELQGNFIDEEVEQLLRIALLCTRTDPKHRPTMLQIVSVLKSACRLAEMEAEWFMDDIGGDTLERQYVEDFALDKLQAAIEDFSDKIISEDGFNIIYKGFLDGSPVAVERYNSQSLEYYFEKELEIGRTCFHPNLVRVIGFCKTPEERLLVFRLMVNGSVESWLRGRHESRPPLTWQKRKRIALGAARGLAYLHEKCEKKIIHRDVKAANILLDENFVAVVADLKSAKFMDHSMTHITTTVTGTIGHIAPEYLASGRCSDKTDVFGYGAFLLELITGHRAVDLLEVADEEDRLRADWVKKNYEEGRRKLMVDNDSGAGDFMDAVVVKQLVKIAVLCLEDDPDRRPRMSHVVSMLWCG
ncbi:BRASSINOSTEROID INSENSITIVE 1-associated receptor kinase 1-like [Salvia miltiorrhiza]|uniref:BRASSINOSTEROID INSENSITIVE 1-associated receptor kinase 1-like n=1 Tax=Salvia miltiorrhiza TaxID=226208 RepID=UPI0025ABCEB9|nr:BRASSINOSTEROID INSENSITIVE 1-associated receptor kinase 1-like [Salvia miltiorrhiza]